DRDAHDDVVEDVDVVVADLLDAPRQAGHAGRTFPIRHAGELDGDLHSPIPSAARGRRQRDVTKRRDLPARSGPGQAGRGTRGPQPGRVYPVGAVAGPVSRPHVPDEASTHPIRLTRMRARWITSAMLIAGVVLSGMAPALAQPAAPPPTEAPAPVADVTPMRLSYLDGEVSFWRPGGDDWAPARVNTPLAPGDALYAGRRGSAEIQVDARAFGRVAEGAQLTVDGQEPDFLQFRLTAGHAAIDARQLPAGATIEVDTPTGALTVDRAGYYRVDVDDSAATFRAYRGGSASVTPANGAALTIAAGQQAVVPAASGSGVAVTEAPPIGQWDRWNYQRTAYLVQHADARYVSPAVYGADTLDQHGTWRTVETYGNVWVPSGVAPGWAPYTTGRWIWDPRFGWTWLDDAPWGWAPYHYGRWVWLGSVWAWAPGPVLVRPAYAPALVVFLSGPVVAVARPVCWAPLRWGEPVVPWWGRVGFV